MQVSHENENSQTDTDGQLNSGFNNDTDGQLNSDESNSNQTAPIEEIKNSNMLPPMPPDGGWGWVIVFSSFMCNFIIGSIHLTKHYYPLFNALQHFLISDGFGYSFGILLNPLAEYYGADQNTVSLVGSIYFGTLLMSGPIAGKIVLIQASGATYRILRW